MQHFKSGKGVSSKNFLKQSATDTPVRKQFKIKNVGMSVGIKIVGISVEIE